MKKLDEVLFNKLGTVKSELKPDGNRYSDDFTYLSITIKTKGGKLVDRYSASQKNITGLYLQGLRVLEKAKKTHEVTINVNE